MKHTNAVKLVERFGGVVGQNVGRGTGRYSALIPSTGFRVAWTVGYKGNLTGHCCFREDNPAKVVDAGNSFTHTLALALWQIAIARQGDVQVKVENWYTGPRLSVRCFRVYIEQIGRDEDGNEGWVGQQQVVGAGTKRQELNRLAEVFLHTTFPSPLLDWVAENTVGEGPATIIL